MQSKNARPPISTTLSGIITDFNLSQFSNAPQLIFVTPFGIVTFTTFLLFLNATFPISVTLYPSITDGIASDDALPLYPVIVAFPSLSVV